MPVSEVIDTGRVPVMVYTDALEPTARRQLENLSRLPIIRGHVAAMPDVHAGIGATVGAVIPTERAIIPAAVGVDIGCGLDGVRLSLAASDLPDSLRRVRSAIERVIPVGTGLHTETVAEIATVEALGPGLRRILDRHPAIAKLHKRPESTWLRQLGSLGGGNHFIELCLDDADRVWLILHSGSRGIGNAIGRYFIALAREDMGRHLANLPDRDLAYLREGAVHFDDYMAAVTWAQDYAAANRREMVRLILRALRRELPPFEILGATISCHHNYVAKEFHLGADVFVTRKGAIRAGDGDLGIIPGSMGTRSYVVRGKGEATSFQSCAHGAGRRMSRREAVRRFSISDLVEQTAGVECRKDKGVLDEAPRAYKDIDQVMLNQADLVEVVHTLKQVVCVKG